MICGSTGFLTISDQTDVGISNALHIGFGFFGHPNAVPPDPPYGKVCPAMPEQGLQRFHVLRCSQDDLGPPPTPAAQLSRRATLQSPNLTACLLAQAFQSLWLD